MSREPSGTIWCHRFPTSSSLGDLVQPFQQGARAFVAALRDAGASVAISATRRAAERAYLMHWCWLVAGGHVSPTAVPAMDGVDIDWTHAGDSEAAATAAILMKHEYDLAVLPSLTSRHIEGRAIDMTIKFQGAIAVRDALGVLRNAASLTDLRPIGATYGLRKLAADPPHWSDDGH